MAKLIPRSLVGQAFSLPGLLLMIGAGAAPLLTQGAANLAGSYILKGLIFFLC
jgi:hypothetical protein